MQTLKLKFVAWLIKMGFKPHESNITHFRVGYGIGLSFGAVTFALLALIIPMLYAVLAAVVVAIISACIAGWVKEKKDDERFDWLDLTATAIGGVLSGVTILIIYNIVTLIF